MSLRSLDELIARARSADVRPDHARSYVADLARWAGVERPSGARWAWLAGGLALAAAVAILVLQSGSAPVAPAASSEPTRIGARVAILAAPGTVYRISEVGAARTALVVDRGTVTARLWPGAGQHELALRGAGVEAIAIGTVYALTVDERGAVLQVFEGSVELREGEARRTVPAGAVWPPRVVAGDGEAARRLFAMAAPEPAREDAAPAEAPSAPPVPSDAAPLPARGLAAADAGIDASLDAPPPADGPPPTLRDRWRQARLLRSQGKLDAALAECLAIADARDATWSPIALVEAARIELGPMADPERAVALAERFAAEWPSHGLAPEARELRCRALRQLGRGRSCAADAGSP